MEMAACTSIHFTLHQIFLKFQSYPLQFKKSYTSIFVFHKIRWRIFFLLNFFDKIKIRKILKSDKRFIGWFFFINYFRKLELQYRVKQWNLPAPAKSKKPHKLSNRKNIMYLTFSPKRNINKTTLFKSVDLRAFHLERVWMQASMLLIHLTGEIPELGNR